MSVRSKKKVRRLKRRIDLAEAWVVALLARVGELEVVVYGEDASTVNTMFPDIDPKAN